VARAVAHELEREELQAFLGEMDKIHRQVSSATLTKARRAWPKR
jgi:hypothetical protein